MQKVSWCTFTAGSVIYLAASGAIRIATISGAERRKWNDYGAHIFARREAGPHPTTHAPNTEDRIGV